MASQRPYTYPMLTFFRRLRAWAKLSRGKCESCGRILPDIHPISGYQACSETCAVELWATRAG